MRDELEAALRADFSRAQLEVYADHLQAEGDPRGELIALELAGKLIDQRKLELLRNWLGKKTGYQLWKTSRIENGFIADLRLDSADPNAETLLEDLLALDRELYIRRISIIGPGTWIDRSLLTLAKRKQLWLAELAIRTLVPHRLQPIVSPKRVDAVIAATPVLEKLVVTGRSVFAEIDHPNVRTLAVSGFDAIGSLVGHGAPLRQVTTLDYALQRELPSDQNPVFGTVLPADSLPALERLDLSRNEPGNTAPSYLGGTVELFNVLEHLPLATQLTHLRVPSLRTITDLESLQRTIDRIEHLEELEIARVYWQYPRLAPHHAKARIIIPPAFPWPPHDTLRRYHQRQALTTWPDGEQYGYLYVEKLVLLVERHFAELSPEARADWTEAWELISILAINADGELPTRLFSRALAALPRDELGEWTALADALARPRYDSMAVVRHWIPR